MITKEVTAVFQERKPLATIFSAVFFFLFSLGNIPLSAEPVFNKHGGQIVFSTNSDPRSFNDILAKESSTTVVTQYIFEGLTTTNAFTLKVEPNLAQNWDISPDGLSWIFHLRRDVLWNDGVSFTADDVVFTFNDLIYNQDIPSSARDVFTIEEKIFKVEKIDDLTVKFTLPVKFAPFLRAMGQAILPKHKLEKVVREGKFNFTWGIDTDPKEIVGTGPFKLVRYDPGQRLVFEKNPKYWKRSVEGDQLPYFDKIVYLIIPSQDTELLKFLEGTIDTYDVRGTDYPLVKPLETKKNFTIYDLGADMGSSFLVFNQNPGINSKSGKSYVEPYKSVWFRDPNFRRAIAHAIDKKKIIEIVKNGLGYLQDSPMGQSTGFFHNPNVVKYDYDLEKAKVMLKAAGFEDRDHDGIIEDKAGHDVEFTLYTNADNSERVDIAGIIRHDVESLGIKINFQALEFNTLVGKLNSSFEWEAIILGLTGGVEPHFGKNVWVSDGGLHLWYPNQKSPATDWEKRLDEIFNLGVQELNEDKRKVLYDEYQLIASQEVPVIYTVLSARLGAVRNKFGNIKPSLYSGIFHNIEEIYLKSEYRK